MRKFIMFICNECNTQRLSSRHNQVKGKDICDECLEKMEVEQLIAIHTGIFPIVRQNKKIKLGVRMPKIVLALEN